MESLTVVALIIGSFTVTSYQSVPSQTDSSPFVTSINERVHPHGVAVHPSLLCPVAKVLLGKNTFRLCKRKEKGCLPNKVHYHDVLYVEDIGFKVVNDVMAKKTAMNSKVDIWVNNKEEEKNFDNKFKNRKLFIWRISSETSHKEAKLYQRN